MARPQTKKLAWQLVVLQIYCAFCCFELYRTGGVQRLLNAAPSAAQAFMEEGLPMLTAGSNGLTNDEDNDISRSLGAETDQRQNGQFQEGSNSSAVAIPPDFDPSLNTNGCLITKDDLSLVPEWIAYHYHAMQMRYLLVAVDPNSATNVTPVFERFRAELPDLEIVELHDEDFLPSWFVVDKNFTTLRHWKGTLKIKNVEERRLAQQLNRHQFRQRTLMHYCTVRVRQRQRKILSKSKSPKKPQPNWLMHIDSDEFMVPNPMWRASPNTTSFLPTPIPREVTAGSMIRYVRDIQKNFPESGHLYPPPSKVCMIMAMLTFGGTMENMLSKEEIEAIPRFDPNFKVEVSGIPPKFNASRFETLAYPFHKDFKTRMQKETGQKVIMDVDINGPLPSQDQTIIGPEVTLVHHPSHRQCRRMVGDRDNHRDALALNHYKGSLERFTFRDDSRRTEKEYRAQALVRDQRDDGWITTWLKHFVALHGAKKVARLLGDHFLDGRDDQWVTEKTNLARTAGKRIV